MNKYKSSRSGHYEQFGEYHHFIPKPLPPEPVLQMDKEVIELYGEAMLSLGRLGEVGARIPSKRQFIDVYVAKEAVLSSEIEDIHTTLTEILEYKARQKLHQTLDIEDVLNYMKAMDHAVSMIRDQGLPIVFRVITETHAVLLSGARGKTKDPGMFRKVPVFVGELIPPPAHYIPDMISDLEKFINEDISNLPLIKVGLMHIQFETIHPFLDGNGRIGRLLIVLLMLEYGLLKEPILYPSFFFKKFRSEYYARLDGVRINADYEGWIKYFLRGIKASADDVVTRAWQVDELLEVCNKKIELQLTRTKNKAFKLLEQLFHNPVLSINDVAELTETTYPPAQKLVTSFVELGILEQEQNKQRDKRFKFKRYLDILERN